MAENIIKVRQKQRCDTEANWTSKNPVLLAGEIAISSDKNGLMKVGDGKSLWTAIPYSKASLSKTDVTTALGYTPPTTNTTYSIGTSSTAGIVKLYTGTGSNTDGAMTQAAIKSALDGKSGTDHKHDLSTMINTLSTGASVPTDADYFVSQYVGGGTTTTTYHRRPVSALWSYIKEKTDGLYQTKGSYAAASHKHGNADITNIDASKISSGTIDLARLPQGALERCVIVADETARLKLTTATVQKGDTVKVTATNKMYFVVDDTKLTSEAGYEVYTAGTATSVPWSGVTGNPSSMPASDVYAWAKAANKPTYTKSEVGLGNVDNTADKDKVVKAATKLAIARTISLSEGASGKVSFDGSTNIAIPVSDIKEAYLSWGGKNSSGTFGPLDAALINDLGANRLAFGSGNGIKIEYSRDNGATWAEYTTDVAVKSRLLSTGGDFKLGNSSSTNKCTTACQLRITLDTDKIPVYTMFEKFAIYISSNFCNGCYCTIDASLESNPTSFQVFANKVPLSGWPGWNIINARILSYGNNKTEQYGLIRFTFGCTAVNSNVIDGMSLVKIQGFGGVGWSTPSNLAKTGHLYSYDSSQNVTFPAVVTATKFNGAATSVSNSLSIQLNGGAATTFNGSAAKTVNITPSSIGAATSGHSHGVLEDPKKNSSNSTNYISLTYNSPELTDFDYVAVWNKGGNQIGTRSKSDFVLASRTYNVTSGTIYLPWDDSSTHIKLPTIETLTRWNGAYNKNGGSVLAYCNKGAFGTIVTKNAGDYAIAGHTHSYLPLSGGTVTGVTSFTNTTASTSMITGAVKVSGGVGVAGRMSANEVGIGNGTVIKYDSTNKCINFVFS